MNDTDLKIQQPAADAAAPAELLLLFHGVGAQASDLLPLGEWLAPQRPRAWIVSVQAPHPSDLGSGRQWFSVQGVTEDNRTTRVAAALPAFEQAVAAWQAQAGVGPEATTLIGFSQGAIMALAATQRPAPCALRVAALAGRFDQPPRLAPPGLRVHLLHGEQDPVMPPRLAQAGAQQLQALGVPVTLDLFPGLGHGIDARVAECLARRLDE